MGLGGRPTWAFAINISNDSDGESLNLVEDCFMCGLQRTVQPLVLSVTIYLACSEILSGCWFAHYKPIQTCKLLHCMPDFTQMPFFNGKRWKSFDPMRQGANFRELVSKSAAFLLVCRWLKNFVPANLSQPSLIDRLLSAMRTPLLTRSTLCQKEVERNGLIGGPVVYYFIHPSP